ncbi:MAG: type 1 glutamine amidotransferase domain-containing protein [Archangium sp.]|nr:type 1 glutamine amidotransferase domain-containing protein [Archangium sp.]
MAQEITQAPAPKARVAFILDSMFEDSEFRVPYDRIKAAGYEVVVIGREAGRRLEGKKGQEKVMSEKSIGEVSADDFAALVIPGGYSPDHLRQDIGMVGFTRDVFNAGKPVAAVCHAGWMLVEADIAEGHTVTSWPSIKTDLINAGARWVDREVVEDGNLITSRKPDDLPAFSDAILRQLEGHVPERIARVAEVASAERAPAVH